MQGSPPPAFPNAPYTPPQKSIWPILIIVIVGGLCLLAIIGAAILFPVFASAQQSAKRAMTMSSLKITSTSLMLYALDADDRYPPADQWAELAIKASPRNEEKSLQLPGPDNEFVDGKLFHALNSPMGGANAAELEDLQIVLTFWSTKPDKNVHDKLDSLAWTSGSSSYTFVSLPDGSAKALRKGGKVGPDLRNGPLAGTPEP